VSPGVGLPERVRSAADVPALHWPWTARSTRGCCPSTVVALCRHRSWRVGGPPNPDELLDRWALFCGMCGRRRFEAQLRDDIKVIFTDAYGEHEQMTSVQTVLNERDRCKGQHAKGLISFADLEFRPGTVEA
jgi:hypothetical protein